MFSPTPVPLDEVRAVFETNVFGSLAIYQAMLPILRETPGARVVNVSSGRGSLTLGSRKRGLPGGKAWAAWAGVGGSGKS